MTTLATDNHPYSGPPPVAIHIDPANKDRSWHQVASATENRLNKEGIDILRKGLDDFVETVVVEPRYVCKDYRNVYSHFLSKKFVSRTTKCSRLHFFTIPHLSVPDMVMKPEHHQDHYVGYSVIQPVRSGCLGRTVIDPLKCGRDPDSFFCLQTGFRARLQGAEYHVRGYPYMSQSGEATLCAHTALWNVCRYLSERYAQYAEFYPYDLIRMIDDAEGRRVPYRGMSYTDYSMILSKFGCHPVIRKPRSFGGGDWKTDKETYLDIYSYMESGFPVLMSFKGHVATVIGHTTRPDLAFNEPDDNGFHHSYALLGQYVVVDDNFFPYQLLGDKGDPADRNYGLEFEHQLTPYPSKQDIYAAVVPLPEKAFMEPQDARKIASKFFARPSVRPILDQEIKHLGYDPNEPFITRLFLTTSNAFKRRKRLCAKGELGHTPDKLAQVPLRLDMPHFVWVMEITPLTLYRTRLIVGEVVLDASANPHERGLLYGRIANTLVFPGKSISYDAAQRAFRQYAHNLGERRWTRNGTTNVPT